MPNPSPQTPNLSQILRRQFGDIDVYVFDALLRGQWRPEHRFLDAGCGTGRNLPCFLDSGFDVWGIDADDDALEITRELVAERRPDISLSQFAWATLESHSLPKAHFDAVLCNAVLHFAESSEQFADGLAGIWRTLAPKGTVLIRMGTRIGIEDKVQPMGRGRFRQPDGAIWYLPDAEELAKMEKSLGATRQSPLKTTWVDGKRAMTTWWLQKPG